MGKATIFPPSSLPNDSCKKCNNRYLCSTGNGITLSVRNLTHLFLPDYKNSWTLSVDLPECIQIKRLFSMANISASLYTGNKAQIKGKIIESRISSLAELHVIEL